MFYVAGSAKLGSMVFTSAKGSQAAPSCQAGLNVWTDRVSDGKKMHIMRHRFGCTEQAITKYKQAHPVKAAKLFPDDKSQLDVRNFNTDGFLVRPNTVQTPTVVHFTHHHHATAAGPNLTSDLDHLQTECCQQCSPSIPPHPQISELSL